MTIGEKIKEYRRENRVTQERLAKHLSISYQAVSKWENEDSQPDISLLVPIAKFFNVSVDDLLNFEGNSNKKNGYRSKRDQLVSLYESQRSDVNFKNATTAYEEVILYGEASADDYWNFAYLYDTRAKQDTEIALEYYEKAINCNSIGQEKDVSIAYGEFTRLLMRLNKNDEAITRLENWHKRDKDNIYPYVQLANCHCVMGNSEIAQEYLDDAKVINDESAEVYMIQGDVYYQLKAYKKAIVSWDKSFELDSQYAFALYSKAHLYEELKDTENAVLIWNEIIEWHKRQGFDLGSEMDYPQNKLKCLLNQLQ